MPWIHLILKFVWSFELMEGLSGREGKKTSELIKWIREKKKKRALFQCNTNGRRLRFDWSVINKKNWDSSTSPQPATVRVYLVTCVLNSISIKFKTHSTISALLLSLKVSFRRVSIKFLPEYRPERTLHAVDLQSHRKSGHSVVPRSLPHSVESLQLIYPWKREKISVSLESNLTIPRFLWLVFHVLFLHSDALLLAFTWPLFEFIL